MNKILLFTFILFTGTLNAQSEADEQKGLKVWGNFGVGSYASPAKHHSLLAVNTGINFLLRQKHYVGAHFNVGFNSSFVFEPNRIYFQKLQYVNYGVREKIRNGLYFTPSVGIGIADYSLTRFYPSDVNQPVFFFSSMTDDGFNRVAYAWYKEQSVCVPVRLELSVVSKFAALGVGLEMVIMKYPSFGASVELQFGKLRNAYAGK
jgi:hypothetical protein